MTSNERLKIVQKQKTARQQSIDAALSTVNQQFGRGTVMQLGSPDPMPVAVVPTGSLGVDLALGVGGLPRGRIVELCGKGTSGKTTLALHAIARAQQQGGVALIIDASHKLDLEYARKLGVEVSELLVSQPDHGDHALEVAQHVTRSGAVDLIVIDSAEGLLPAAALESEHRPEDLALLQARLMSRALRTLADTVTRSGTSVLILNERTAFEAGSPANAVANALKYLSSVRMSMERLSPLKEGDAVVGARTRVKVLKNKLAPPFIETSFDLVDGRGIDRFTEAVDLAVDCGVLETVGSMYSFAGERLGQGRERVAERLREAPQLFNDITNRVHQARAGASR